MRFCVTLHSFLRRDAEAFAVHRISLPAHDLFKPAAILKTDLDRADFLHLVNNFFAEFEALFSYLCVGFLGTQLLGTSLFMSVHLLISRFRNKKFCVNDFVPVLDLRPLLVKPPNVYSSSALTHELSADLPSRYITKRTSRVCGNGS
jgi:hypothetical protein